ncbi:plexin-A4-like [Diadema setosum]|uniref:plexin-A4-like n=1 Tax=Diadema setosum TaxID=31175 RepID=UPI003B3B24C3
MECSHFLRTHWKLCSLVVFTCILSLIGDSAGTPVSTYLRGNFRGAPGFVFNHFLVSNATGEEFVYVGARSRIYQLDRNLAHLRNDSTDPNDCGIDCEDNDNTILTIAPSPRNHLVLCRTYDGKCEYRDLTTLFSSGFHGQIVTKRTLGSSFVGLVGPLVGQEFDSYLFVAPTSRDNDNVRPVGIRRLDDQDPALTLYLDFATEIIKSPTINDVKLIDGMEWDNYMFFFLHEITGSSSESKLGRFCTKNNELKENLPSYVEIKLSCGIGALIQAAHIGPVSPQLAQSLDISTDDDALFTTFTRSNVDGSVQSWFCVFPMPAVQEKFIDALYGCGSNNDESKYLGAPIAYIDKSECPQRFGCRSGHSVSPSRAIPAPTPSSPCLPERHCPMPMAMPVQHCPMPMPMPAPANNA